MRWRQSSGSGVAPSGPYLCALQIEQVGFVEFGGGEKRVRTWRPGD